MDRDNRTQSFTTTKEPSKFLRIFETMSSLGLKNKDKQIVRRMPNNLENIASSSQENSQTDLQIAAIENSLHNWSIPLVKKM